MNTWAHWRRPGGRGLRQCCRRQRPAVIAFSGTGSFSVSSGTHGAGSYDSLHGTTSENGHSSLSYNYHLGSNLGEGGGSTGASTATSTGSSTSTSGDSGTYDDTTAFLLAADHWSQAGSNSSNYVEHTSSTLGSAGVWVDSGSLTVTDSGKTSSSDTGSSTVKTPPSTVTGVTATGSTTLTETGTGKGSDSFSEEYALTSGGDWSATGGSSSSTSGTSDTTVAAGGGSSAYGAIDDHWTLNGTDNVDVTERSSAVMGSGGIWVDSGSLSVQIKDNANTTDHVDGSVPLSSSNPNQHGDVTVDDHGKGKETDNVNLTYALGAGDLWQLSAGSATSSSGATGSSTTTFTGGSDYTSSMGHFDENATVDDTGTSKLADKITSVFGAGGTWVTSGSLTINGSSHGTSQSSDVGSVQINSSANGVTDRGHESIDDTGHGHSHGHFQESLSLGSAGWAVNGGSSSSNSSGSGTSSSSGSGSSDFVNGSGAIDDHWSGNDEENSDYSESMNSVFAGGVWIATGSLDIGGSGHGTSGFSGGGEFQQNITGNGVHGHDTEHVSDSGNGHSNNSFNEVLGLAGGNWQAQSGFSNSNSSATARSASSSSGTADDTTANGASQDDWGGTGNEHTTSNDHVTSTLSDGVWVTSGSMSIGGAGGGKSSFLDDASFHMAQPETGGRKESDKGTDKTSGKGTSTFSFLENISFGSGATSVNGDSAAASNGSSTSSSSSSGTTDVTTANDKNDDTFTDKGSGSAGYSGSTSSTLGSDGVWVTTGSLDMSGSGSNTATSTDVDTRRVILTGNVDAGTTTTTSADTDTQTWNYTEDYTWGTNGWQVSTGSQSTTDTSTSNSSTTGGGSYSVAVGSGTLSDTWSETATDDSSSTGTSTQTPNSDGTWTTTASTSSQTDTVDESLSDSFSGSEPAVDGSGTNTLSGSATYTLQEGLLSTNGAAPVITSAALDGSGVFTEDGADAGFSVQVNGAPATLTSTVTQTDTNVLDSLRVSLSPANDWLADFSGQVDGAVGGALAISSGSTASGSSGSSEGPNVGNTTRVDVYNAGGQTLSETVTADATGDVLYAYSATYDSAGHMLTQTDGDGRTTAWAYNAAGEVTSETIAFGTAQAATTDFGYDASGNLVSVTDPDGNVTAYTYNAQNQETSMTDPLGHTETMTWNDQGLLESVTNRDGLTTAYSYDATGRMTGETWYAADGVTVTNQLFFTYNADGTLATAGNDYGTYMFAYDDQGRVIGVTEPFGVSLAFGYDQNGNRVLVQDSFGGTTQSTYDAANQLVSELFTQQGMPTLRIDQTYTADGQIATQTRSSDVAGQNVVATSDYTYDFNGDETQIIHKGPTGAVLAEYDYTFDPAGDLVSETDNGVTTNYEYDVTGQLVGYGSVTQSYDPNGNRNGSGYVVGPDNQLLSDGTWNYTYDAEGNESSKTNITSGATWTYGYDNKNELLSAVETATNGTVEVEADYKYDVFGNRLEKDVWTPAAGTVVTKFAYDGWNPNTPSGVGNENWNVWADLDVNNNLLTRYFRGDAVDQIFGEAGAGGSVAWLLPDHLDSTRVVVDNGGTVLDEIDYDAFGNITSQTNAAEQPRYLYTGREWDVETGLQYNRARYYDPSAGRWISQDPMGFDAGDSNLYRYVRNQPIARTDPSGLEELTFDHIIRAAKKKNLPTALLEELKRIGETDFESGSGGHYRTGLFWWNNNTVTLTKGVYERLLKGEATSSDLGLVYNEILHAYYHQVLPGNGSWTKPLLDGAAGQFKTIMRMSFAKSKPAGFSMVNWNIAVYSRTMVEEAMSEMLQFLATDLYFRDQAKKTGAPPPVDPMASPQFGMPLHTEPGSPWNNWRYKPAAETRVPVYIRHLALWTMQHGSKNPAPGGTKAEMIKALEDNWKKTFK